MTKTVAAIIESALILLKDRRAVRWTVSELVGWLNEGVRAAVALKPDLAIRRSTLPLVAGVEQAIPDTIKRVVKFESNVNGPAITPTSVQLLDSYIPNWRNAATLGSHAIVDHVIVDEADITTFMVFPANDGTGTIRALVETVIAVIVEDPKNPNHLASYAAVDSPLQDAEGDALVDYLCFRATNKDIDLPGMSARATFHYQAFATRMGVEVSAEKTVRPEIPAPDPTV